MKKASIYIGFILLIILSSCIEEKDTELERPKVEILSPLPCDTVYFGQQLLYKVKIIDNTGLGMISMDMHNNFQHHDHGDHESCIMDDIKEAVNPYANGWVFSLPENELSYVFDTLIDLPAMDDDSVFYDTGDYHFHIYVTDNDGYQVFTTLDVRILR